MNKKLIVNQSRAGQWLTLLLALLLTPVGIQAEDYGITIAGVAVTDANAANVMGDGTVSFDAENNILTLTGATINGEILSTLESLTINLEGASQLTVVDNQNSAIQNDADMADLSFTGSGSLAINAAGGVIGDFSSVDFGSFNLASQSAPGVHYDDDRMAAYDGNGASDLTITTDEVYPIWVFDSSLGEESTHRQITASNKGDVLGNGTISLSGSTITLNGVNFNLGEQSAIVVGPGMSSLTAHLLGTNTVTYGPAFYFVGDTDLTFTTSTTEPGSLAVSGDESAVAIWRSEEGGTISYENNLVYTYSGNTQTIDTRILYYGLNVAGIRVSSRNAADILNDGGSVSYEQDTWGYSRVLTLNNATINGKIDIYGGGLTIDILGDNTIVSTDSAAIKNSNYGLTSDLSIKSTGNTLATLKLTPAGESFKAYEGFYISCYDNTALFGEINSDDNTPVAGATITIKRVPAPVFNFPQGIVFTDEDLTITMDIPSEDYEIYWTGKSELDQYKKYEGSFRLTKEDDSYGGYGNPSVYAYVADVEEHKRRTIDVVRLLIVVDRPAFSVASGEYETAQQVAITGLPELETRQDYVGEELQDFPQVWYYLDDDKENAVQYNSEATITVDHTCRLNAYLLAVNDSGIVVNSSLFSADYIIRQEPDYHFSTSTTGQSYYPSGSTVSNLNYGEENTLPWLINVPDGLAISYRSSDKYTATIDEEGHITLKGAGFVKIYASNEETDEYVAHEEWIMLEIRPSDPQSSIEQGAYYTGQELALTPTVPNGEMYYQIGSGEKVKYTEPLELWKGKYEISLYTLCSSDDGEKWSYGNNHPTFYVYDELTFTPASGASSNDDIVVEIGNLPEATDSNPNAVSVYYYFGEDETKAKLYSATDKATVAESTKLNAYIEVEGDSGVYKTEPVEAEYTVIPKTQLNISYAQNSRQWASYYADEKSLETPEGLEANVVTQVSATGVTVSPITYIPQNVPILLKRTADSVTEPIMAKAYQGTESHPEANELEGTASSKAISTVTGGDVYVLYNDGFTRATSGSIPAHRAYLVIDKDAESRLFIWEDEDATRISTIGRGFATTSETLYNLNGQRVSQPSKGLYISNGKKRIVK